MKKIILIATLLGSTLLPFITFAAPCPSPLPVCNGSVGTGNPGHNK